MSDKTCERRMMPLNERRIRPCGKPATGELGGRHFCAEHLAWAEKHRVVVVVSKEGVRVAVLEITQTCTRTWRLALACGHEFFMMSETKPERKLATCPRCP